MTSLYTLWQQRFPEVLFNSELPGVPIPAVNMDEYAAAQRIAETLALAGHRNMCMVSIAVDERLKRQGHRVVGWLEYLENSALLDDCFLPACYMMRGESMMKYFRRLVQSIHRPTALVFAYGLLCEAFLNDPLGPPFTVPDDMSLATFDPVGARHDAPWCPPVTTVTVDMTRVAQCMIEMLERMLEGDFRLRSLRVPMKINLTASVAPLARRIGGEAR
jgi:DNA-binding LacI/PurR family transcriptional regulator